MDIDGVLVIAHSDKQGTTATWKKTFGHHPLMGFVDHGSSGSSEPVAGLLRPGNAGSNAAADHFETARLAFAQLPKTYRPRCRTLIRTDSGGGTHEFVSWLAQQGRWLSYSVGNPHPICPPGGLESSRLHLDSRDRTGRRIRDGACIAGIAGDVLDGRPKGMRLIVRNERQHPALSCA